MAKTDEAFERLKADILNSALLAGTPLVIATLTDRYGLGWTPLREALSRLEAEGLVVSERNRGYRVAPVSASSIRDLQVGRQAAEEALLARSIASGDAEWEGRIVAAHHTFARTPVPGPGVAASAMAEWELRHDGFHDALLSAGDSDCLMRFQRQVTEQLRRHHRHMLFDPAAHRELDDAARAAFTDLVTRTLGLAHHTQMMEATLDRDTTAAVALLREHIGFSLAVYAFLWPQDA